MATERELNILIRAKDEASKVLDKYEKQFKDIGKTLLAVGGAGAAGLGAAVKVAADFESGMSRVGALSRASDEDLARLTQTAKELGAATSFSAKQASEGMSYLAMAGFDVNETIAAMPGLLATAAAGQTDLATTSDIVSNILSGFQIEAANTGRVADVLSAAFTSSNTDLNMLGDTMKYVAPVASAAGFSLEEMAAATGLMGNAGIQGSQAGTSLRSIIMRLQAPVGKAAGMMEELGIQVRNADGSMKSMPDILAEFEGALSGVDQATADMALKTIIGQEAAAGFTALLNEGSDVLAAYTGELENSGGVAQEIADRQLDNLNGAMTILKSGIEGAAIAIGSVLTPYLQIAAEWLTEMVAKFNALDPDLQRKIALFAAIGTGLALLTGAILLVIPMLPALAAAFGALFGPVGLVIAAVVGLAIAIQQNFGLIQELFNQFIPVFQFFFDALTGGMDHAKQKAAESGVDMSSSFMTAAVTIIEIITELKDMIIQTFNTLKDLLLPMVDFIWTSIKNFIDTHGQQIMDNLRSTWDIIKNIIDVATQAVVTVIEWAFPFIQQIISMVMNNVVPFLIDMWQKISDFIHKVMPPIVELIKTAWEKFIEPIITGVMKRLIPAIESAWNFIKGIIDGVLNIIMGIVKFFVNLLTGDWEGAWDGIVQFTDGILGILITVFTDGLGLVWDVIKTIFGSIFDWMGGLVSLLFDIGKNIITGLIDGVKAMAKKLFDSVIGVVKGAIDGVKSFLGIASPSRLMIEMGVFTGEGWVLGLQDQAREALRAAEDVAAMSVSPFEKAHISPGSYNGSGSSGSGGGSGDTYLIFEFGEGSVVLPEVKDGQQFVDELQAFGLRQAFKSQ